MAERVQYGNDDPKIWKSVKKLGGTPACHALKAAMKQESAIIGPDFGFFFFLSRSPKTLWALERGEYMFFRHLEWEFQYLQMTRPGRCVRPDP